MSTNLPDHYRSGVRSGTELSIRAGRIRLRECTADDKSLLLEIYASTRADELAAVPWDDAQKAAFVRSQFDLQDAAYHTEFADAAFSIVLLDEMVAGRLYVAIRGDEVRVIDVSLLPEYRGRGVGEALLRAVMAEGESRRLPVRLHVESANPARRLYERLGFAVRSDDSVYVSMERA
jgi:ribosomal protein S18 acetylase RimI-like enzyme